MCTFYSLFHQMLQKTEIVPLCLEATVTSSSPLGPLEGWHFLPLSFISSLICKVVRRYRLLLIRLPRGAPSSASAAHQAYARGTVLSCRQEMQMFTVTLHLEPNTSCFPGASLLQDSTTQQEPNVSILKSSSVFNGNLYLIKENQNSLLNNICDNFLTQLEMSGLVHTLLHEAYVHFTLCN